MDSTVNRFLYWWFVVTHRFNRRVELAVTVVS
jgi:hypothetical protein